MSGLIVLASLFLGFISNIGMRNSLKTRLNALFWWHLKFLSFEDHQVFCFETFGNTSINFLNENQPKSFYLISITWNFSFAAKVRTLRILQGRREKKRVQGEKFFTSKKKRSWAGNPSPWKPPSPPLDRPGILFTRGISSTKIKYVEERKLSILYISR